jgi:hypothetical protein
MKIDFTVVGLLIVLAPLLILALHYHNRNQNKSRTEAFAASQGGVLIQLATSRVVSEEEVKAQLEQNKRQVVSDIVNLTEPESRPGPLPASAVIPLKLTT